MQRDTELILLLAVGIVGFVVYSKFFGKNEKATEQTLNKTFKDYSTTKNAGLQLKYKEGTTTATRKDITGKTTRYFFNEKDLNFAQRTLLNIGVSPKWVLE